MNLNRKVPRSHLFDIGFDLLYTQNRIDNITQKSFIQVKNFYNPNSGSPELIEGDRYISTDDGELDDVKWRKNYIYEYNGYSWDEIAPDEGHILILSDIYSIFLFINNDWQLQNNRLKDYGISDINTETYLFDPTKYSHYKIIVNHDMHIKPATSNYLNGIPYEVIFYIINGGSHGIAWDNQINWVNGNPPSLSINGTDIVSFMTIDGGNTWEGTLIGLNYMNNQNNN